MKSKKRLCRSFKNFNSEDFLIDLQNQNFDIDEESNDINKCYNHFQNYFTEVINKHAPFKERKILSKQIPYMNKELRSATYKKKMLFNKFQKLNNSRN